MGEDRRAVALDMLVEPDAGASLGHGRCECSLADLKRIAPQIIAVQFDQVEGVQERTVIMAVISSRVAARGAGAAASPIP